MLRRLQISAAIRLANLTCALSVVAEYGDTFTLYYHFNAGYFPHDNYIQEFRTG